MLWWHQHWLLRLTIQLIEHWITKEKNTSCIHLRTCRKVSFFAFLWAFNCFFITDNASYKSIFITSHTPQSAEFLCKVVSIERFFATVACRAVHKSIATAVLAGRNMLDFLQKTNKQEHIYFCLMGSIYHCLAIVSHSCRPTSGLIIMLALYNNANILTQNIPEPEANGFTVALV